MQRRVIGYGLLATWTVYLFCFSPSDLGDAPPYVWILLLAAIVGITASAGTIFAGKARFTEQFWGRLLIAAVSLLLLMYVVQWLATVTSLGRALESDSLGALIESMISLKVRTVSSLLQKGQTIYAMQQVYWELIPFIQVLLTSLWIVLQRRNTL